MVTGFTLKDERTLKILYGACATKEILEIGDSTRADVLAILSVMHAFCAGRGDPSREREWGARVIAATPLGRADPPVDQKADLAALASWVKWAVPSDVRTT